MFRLLAILLCLTFGATLPLPTAAAPSPSDLNQRITDIAPELVAATVAIFINANQPGAGSGSGVIVSSDGLIMTAAHVTSTPGESFTVLLSDGTQVPATSLGVDHETDGALLRITKPGNYPFRPYVEDKAYQIGDWVLATGHPGGPVVGRPAPVRLGRITKDGTRSGFTDPITTTAAVISGDSGGPLFNLNGEVIGINSNIQGNWLVNNHVPVPCILKRWDALMAGESFGKAPDNNLESLIDDPFAAIREQYLDLLEQHPEDPAAAELLARPRLLDPHHMQAHIDRLQAAGDGETANDADSVNRPFFGLRFDLSSPRALIREVVADSPAERQGLRREDVVTSFEGQPVTDTASFARLLKRLDPESLSPTRKYALSVDRGGIEKKFTVVAELHPARRHFPQPLASFVGSMLREGDDHEVTEDFEKAREEFSNALTRLSEDHSTVEIRRDDKTLALATVIAAKDHVITKASNLGVADDYPNLIARHGETEFPVKVIAIDKRLDLALLQTTTSTLTPVIWSSDAPATGSLLLSPTAEVIRHGVITQPSRPAPKVGFDHPITAQGAPPWLGLLLDTGADDEIALVSRVDPGSPADFAGVLEGDVIVAINGTPIEEFAAVEAEAGEIQIDDGAHKKDSLKTGKIDAAATLLNELAKRQPGEKFRLGLKRNDRSIDVAPVLGTRRKYSNRTSLHAVRVDQALGGLSAHGGDLSVRRQGFPRCLYHDTRIDPADCGAPLLDLSGQAVGLNIARSLRHRSLAIPAAEVQQFIEANLPKETDP